MFPIDWLAIIDLLMCMDISEDEVIIFFFYNKIKILDFFDFSIKIYSYGT